MTGWKPVVAVGALLVAGGFAGWAATLSPAHPSEVRLVTPSGATGSTTTTQPGATTTTTAPATSTTLAVGALAPAPTTTVAPALAPAPTTTVAQDVTVPNVVGMTYANAQSALTAVDLQIAPGASCEMKPNGDANPNAVVTWQSLPPGSTLAPRDQVSVEC